jgi:hypothetical protein
MTVNPSTYSILRENVKAVPVLKHHAIKIYEE